jgi:hypothetical protein
MNKPIIKVNDLASFEFWVGMFKPRSKKWQKETLRKLKKKVSVFETAEDHSDKIKALKFLLN